MAEQRPDIVFVHTDQQSLNTIAAYGHPGVETPNLDRLVSRGVSCMNSYSADPVCCPARASWFTGRPPIENGVWFNGYPIREDVPDLGQWLSARGYRAVYTGKWHVPNRSVAESFDYLPGATGVGELCDPICAAVA